MPYIIPNIPPRYVWLVIESCKDGAFFYDRWRHYEPAGRICSLPSRRAARDYCKELNKLNVGRSYRVVCGVITVPRRPDVRA